MAEASNTNPRSEAEAKADEKDAIAHGMAPSKDSGDPRTREEIEAEAMRDAGKLPDPVEQMTGDEQKALGETRTIRPKTDAERTAEDEAYRSRAVIAPQQIEVTYNGLRYIVPAGVEVDVPEPVAQIIEQSQERIRTAQMAGGTDGVPTIDLTKR